MTHPTKTSFMARLARIQKSLFLTPAQSREQAQAQLDVINTGLALQRQQLKDATLALVEVRLKPVKNAFEVKLVINREAMETYRGEQAGLEIAMAVAQEVIRRHRQLTPKSAGKVAQEKAKV